MKTKQFLLAMAVLLASTQIYAQGGFGPQLLITFAASDPKSVYAADLDGDGDMDVLSASSSDDKIAWYENDGSGGFSTQQVISTAAYGACSVYAADLDGDGDMDVLSASSSDDKIAWYKNNGKGNFGAQRVISSAAYGACSVYAADLDGDGDMDVLWASEFKIAWFENNGRWGFSAQQFISTSSIFIQSINITDIDGDGDMDVLSSEAWGGGKIAWYENDGSGGFGPQQVITNSADEAVSVYAADLDGDGDMDVLSASYYDDKIAWYENDGSGGFGPQQVITTTADRAYSVYAADLDGDGDTDVLSASTSFDKICWYENIYWEIWISENLTMVSCKGLSDGSIDINVSNGSSPYTYLWSTGATTEDISDIPAGIYSVTVTDDSLTMQIESFEIKDPVDFVITISSSNMVANSNSATLTASGASTYTWSETSQSGAIASISPTANTTYTVTGTDENGCTDTASITIVVTEPTGMEEAESIELTLYPNPTDGKLYIESEEAIDKVEIYNQSTLVKTIAPVEGKEIDLSGLSAGVYIIRLYIGESVVVRKISVIK